MGTLGLGRPLTAAGSFEPHDAPPVSGLVAVASPGLAGKVGTSQGSVIPLGHLLIPGGKLPSGEQSCLCLEVWFPELGFLRSCVALSRVSGVMPRSFVTQFPHS